MILEKHNLHGNGREDHEVYPMPTKTRGLWTDYWEAVTNVPCPVPGCNQTVLWYEAGYVPGYRVCMAPNGDGSYRTESIRHKFIAKGKKENPVLVRDHCCEKEYSDASQ